MSGNSLAVAWPWFPEVAGAVVKFVCLKMDADCIINTKCTVCVCAVCVCVCVFV